MPPPFKILVVGAAKSGKSAFVNRQVTGEFIDSYTPTVGCSVHKVTYQTSQGPAEVELWDTAGNDSLAVLADAYYLDADAAIILFDVTDRETFQSVESFYRRVTRVCDRIPFVIVGSKVDIAERVVQPKDVSLFGRPDGIYYEASSRCSYGLERPILFLLQALLKDSALTIQSVPTPAQLEAIKNGEDAARAAVALA